MDTTIIPTTTAEHLAHQLAGQPALRIIFPEKNKEGRRHFPDGEIYTRISAIRELTGRVVVLHAGMPQPNAGLVELGMLLDILTTSTASRLEVFFSYAPYGMQDKVFRDGEINAAESIIKKLVSYYSVKKIYTIDAHFFGRPWTSAYPLVNISAVEQLKQTARHDYPDIIFMTPDEGASRRIGLKGTSKKRIHSYEVEINSDDEFKQKIQGQTIGVIDDLLETGGTLERFYQHCHELGAKKLVALITHGVLPSGIARTKKTYEKLYLCNTIAVPEANVDITPLVAEALS